MTIHEEVLHVKDCAHVFFVDIHKTKKVLKNNNSMYITLTIYFTMPIAIQNHSHDIEHLNTMLMTPYV